MDQEAPDGPAVLDGVTDVPWADRDGSIYRVTRDVHVSQLSVGDATLIMAGHHITVDVPPIVIGPHGRVTDWEAHDRVSVRGRPGSLAQPSRPLTLRGRMLLPFRARRPH